MTRELHEPGFIDLLRRIALTDPERVQGLLAQGRSTRHPAIEECLATNGPLTGLAQLSSLFPRGYLEGMRQQRESGADLDYAKGVVDLLRFLDKRLDASPRGAGDSLSNARLDDIVAREVLSTHRNGAGTSDRALLLQHLFDAYEVPPRLNRLEKLMSILGTSVDLSDTLVVAHQHVLGSVVSQFKALWRLGLDPRRTYIAGKPYSINRLAYEYLRREGANIRSGLDHFQVDNVLSPEWYQSQNQVTLNAFLNEALATLLKKEISTLVIIDDGGLVLKALDTLTSGLPSTELSRFARVRVVGVEQTTFGKHLVQRMGTSGSATSGSSGLIPVSNVANTRLKLERESKLIAKSVIDELHGWIAGSDARDEHVRTLSEATVGVIGFGAVGSWICRELRDGPLKSKSVMVFDEDVSHSSIARSFGYEVAPSTRHLAEECSVIVGCSGAPAGVALSPANLKRGTILASASSGNYEFARVFIGEGTNRHKSRINPDITPHRDASSFDWMHSIFRVDAKGGDAFVLNGGFPVNFTGAVDPIRAEDIELTRCLIVLGVASALQGNQDGPNFGGKVRMAQIDESILTDLFTP